MSSSTMSRPSYEKSDNCDFVGHNYQSKLSLTAHAFDSVSFSDPNILDSAQTQYNLPHCLQLSHTGWWSKPLYNFWFIALFVARLTIQVFLGLSRVDCPCRPVIVNQRSIIKCMSSQKELRQSCALKIFLCSISVFWLPLFEVPLLLVSVIAQLFIPITSPQLFIGSEDVTRTEQNRRVIIYCPDLLRRIKNYPLWYPASSCSHRLFKPCLAPHDNNNACIDFLRMMFCWPSSCFRCDLPRAKVGPEYVYLPYKGKLGIQCCRFVITTQPCTCDSLQSDDPIVQDLWMHLLIMILSSALGLLSKILCELSFPF